MKASQLLIECAHRRIMLRLPVPDSPIELCRPPGHRATSDVAWVIGQILRIHRSDLLGGYGGVQVKIEPFDTVTFSMIPNPDPGNVLSLIDDLLEGVEP